MAEGLLSAQWNTMGPTAPGAQAVEPQTGPWDATNPWNSAMGTSHTGGTRDLNQPRVVISSSGSAPMQGPSSSGPVGLQHAAQAGAGVQGNPPSSRECHPQQITLPTNPVSMPSPFRDRLLCRCADTDTVNILRRNGFTSQQLLVTL